NLRPLPIRQHRSATWHVQALLPRYPPRLTILQVPFSIPNQVMKQLVVKVRLVNNFGDGAASDHWQCVAALSVKGEGILFLTQSAIGEKNLLTIMIPSQGRIIAAGDARPLLQERYELKTPVSSVVAHASPREITLGSQRALSHSV
ncbi:MAG TPA: hypothetical protein VMT53_16330, partial [Terriglobales bacterium]|nr:hypothetical protein [Terriglobales bacterium]